MTKEERQLLLNDLCARLSYGVIVNVPIIGGSENKKLVSIINEDDGIPCGSVYSCEVRNSNGELVSYEKSTYLLCDIIPYLRPMSSMTEEEKEEWDNYVSVPSGKSLRRAPYCIKYMEWLLEHHFDFRHLIEKGLALEAPEGMYKK